MSQCFFNHSAFHNLTDMKPSFLTFGVGVEKITIRTILGKFQSPWTVERKYLRHWIQVFSTTEQVKASNAIAMNNGDKIGLMLVILLYMYQQYLVSQATNEFLLS